MRRLILQRMNKIEVPLSTVWLLESVSTARERFQPFAANRAPHFEALRQHAILTSVESSNRIEGVEVEAGRLLPLVLRGAKPKDRSEEEIVGYTRALEAIQAERFKPPLTTNTVLDIHALSYGGAMSSDAGQWKRTDNDIIEIDAVGRRSVRFVTVRWQECADMMETLCATHGDVLRRGGTSELLAAFTLVLDFLCVHPFRDGNGRASRLLTAMLLRWQGHIVVDYVSLEQIIEQDKDSYYAVLQSATKDWHEGRANPIPWWNFMTGVLSRAYQFALEAAATAPSLESSAPKADLVRAAVLRRTLPFTRAEIVGECPGISDATVQMVLQHMKAAGEIVLTGRGRGAVWRVVRRQE